MQGITGKLSGKMGAAVFRVREGQQIVTQYNPIVKNPNTAGQQSQRAKFKLMSQLAAIMAPGYGTMGTINRPARGKVTQRNAFTQLNMSLVEVDTQGQEVVAKVPMEQLKLTSSFRYLPELELDNDEGKLGTSMSAIPSEVTTIRVVVVGYKGQETTQASIIAMADVPVDDERFIKHTFEDIREGKYTVLAYGLIPSETAKASIDLGNIHTPSDDDFISAVELNAMVADGNMAETMTVGGNITLTA